MIPIVIGALGKLSKNFSSWAAKIEVEGKTDVKHNELCGTEGGTGTNGENKD